MLNDFKPGDVVHVTFHRGGYWKGTGRGVVTKVSPDGKRVSVDVNGRVRSFLVEAGSVRHN